MYTVRKTVLAFFLALGFFSQETGAAPSSAKPSVAFLGLDQDADPLFHKELTLRIRRDLSGDTAVRNLSTDEIDPIFARGALASPEGGPLEAARLANLGAQYYAFGWLEPVALDVTRKWTKPWDVKVRWSQGLRLRVVSAETGAAVFDGVIPAEINDKAFVMAPDAPDNEMSPVERDACYRRMLPVLSQVCAQAVSKVVRGKMERPADAGPAVEVKSSKKK